MSLVLNGVPGVPDYPTPFFYIEIFFCSRAKTRTMGSYIDCCGWKFEYCKTCDRLLRLEEAEIHRKKGHDIACKDYPH